MLCYALVARWSGGSGALLGELAAQGLRGNYRDVAAQLLAAADRRSRQQAYTCDSFRFCCLFVEEYGFLSLAAVQSSLSEQFAFLDSLCASLLPSLQLHSESLDAQRQIVQAHFSIMYPVTAAAAASAVPVNMCLPPLALERMQCYAPPITATTTTTTATTTSTTTMATTTTSSANNAAAFTAFDPFAELFPTRTSLPPPAAGSSMQPAVPQPTQATAVGFNPFDDFAIAAAPAPPSEGCWLDQFSSEPPLPPAVPQLSVTAPAKGAARPRWGSKDDIDALFAPAPAPLPELGAETNFATAFQPINGHDQAANAKKAHRRRSSEPKQLPDSRSAASSSLSYDSSSHSGRARSTDDRPRTPKRGGGCVADVGLILPIDYSGMSDDGSADGAKLLSKLDTQVKNALVTQLGIASSYDEVMTVLHIFREILANVPLPPAMSVRFEQAVKDANRERILLGKQLFTSDFQSLWDALQDAVRPLVVGGDEMIVEAVCKDILRASSRTASGGDSYSIISCLFGNEDVVITPAPVECRPIAINIDRDAFVISIVSEDKFVMRRVDEMEPSSQFESAAVDGPSAPSSGKANTRGKSPKSFGFLFGKRSSHKQQSAIAELPQNEQISELHPQGKSLSLTSTITTELRLVDTMNPCIRTLSITTDLVEQTPEQLIVLGAGDPRVNKNPYELQGFRNRSPWYLNPAGVHFTLEHLPADDTWLWAIGVPPVCLYLCAGECGQMPPLEGWQPQCDAVPEPAPTVMPSNKRLTKKRSTPRNNTSQQAAAETPLSAQFKIFGRRLSISSAASSTDDDRRTPRKANTPDRKVVTDIMNSVFEHEEKGGPLGSAEPIAPLPLMDLSRVTGGAALVPPIDTSLAQPCSSAEASSVGSPGMCSPVGPITIKAVDTVDEAAAHEVDPTTMAPVHTPTSGSHSSSAAAAATPEPVEGEGSGGGQVGGDAERRNSGGKRFKPPWRWFEHAHGHGHGSAATSPARSPAPITSSEVMFDRPRHSTTSVLPRPGSAGAPTSSERSVSVPPASGGHHRLKGLPQFAIRPWRKDKATAGAGEELSNDSDDEGIAYGIMATFSSKLEDDSP